MISFSKGNTPKIVKPQEKNIENPDWIKCPSCRSIQYAKQLEENLSVCPKCNFYFKLSASKRIEILLDENTFEETDTDLSSFDILKFSDTKPYTQRLEEGIQKTNHLEAIITGLGNIENTRVAIGVMDFDFVGGSMGIVVGEKIVRLADKARLNHTPLILVSSSGGARMQEGIFSLMQMARTSAAIGKFQEQGGLYISILTNPTTGGVSASFAFLGDIIIAEPSSVIGFAGARIIEQTTKQKLPAGFQTAEFLLDHGQLDKIVERKNMRKLLTRLLQFYSKGKTKA
ncbi:MAG: acetyl-CoA carboxylase, carboxyltransferase subunit beta [Caldisericia bacterium]|nr:acetyl-CoA carboxylase, carboxyltransferase subunit beta [Caldisericia bacterium]